jgi:hypothetical protein
MRRCFRVVKVPFFNPMIESESVRRGHSRFNDYFDTVVKNLCVVRSPARWELAKPVVVIRINDTEDPKLMIR